MRSCCQPGPPGRFGRQDGLFGDSIVGEGRGDHHEHGDDDPHGVGSFGVNGDRGRHYHDHPGINDHDDHQGGRVGQADHNVWAIMIRSSKDPIATRSLRAIGTTAVVAVTDVDRADEALAYLADELAALDEACSRFRDDSEIRRLERRSNGRPVIVGPLLFEAIRVGCDVAVLTAGTVDPTVGSALVDLGYDRDFDAIGAVAEVDHPPEPAPGWWRICLDPDLCSVGVPAGVHLDLGATAKAFAADRAANGLASRLGCGVLVNLGGDVAVAGQPPGDGWAVGIASHCRASADEVDVVLSLNQGAVATSGTTGRTWTRGARQLHHIVDPWTGEPAPPVWSLVSTLARNCVEANAWSTAAVVWGLDAVGNLAINGVPARLVDAKGRVTVVGSWPTEFRSDHQRGRGA